MSERGPEPTYERVKSVLLDLLELAPADADQRLEAIAAGDAALAARVRRLLDAHREAGSFLDVPDEGLHLTPPVAPPTPAAGDRIGPFTIERELGHGGMGTVLLGSRSEGGFVQRVAIKVIRGAGLGQTAVARLRDERRILASLSHPLIAHFVDGGTTADGQPYLAMEYVDGVPITRYCDERQLGTAARVRLFLRVCDAVRFAHTRLVVHRDIKPSNILVTADGTPKLLDFGIAKLIDPLQVPDAATVHVLTPHYASPEQAAGTTVTTASDVYSLGVLLYELLTGASPYRSVSPASPLLAVLQAIRSEDPERPSLAALRAKRSLDEDLDAVLLKALRKDEADRYRTVAELMDDLERRLDGRPVLAHDGSRAYRFRRFVSRNRAAVAGSSIAVASLLVAVVVSTWQAQVARRERALADARFSEVRSLANAVVGPLYDAIAKVPGSTDARQVLVKQALTYLDRLASQAQQDVPLKIELAEAYQKIGDVQGNLFDANLGDMAGARTSYERLLALRQAVYEARPADVEARRKLGIAHSRLGDVALGLGKFEESVAAYTRSIQLFEQFRDTSELGLIAHSTSLQHLAVALNWGDRKDDAIARFKQALALIEPLAEQPNVSEEVRRTRMSARGNLGDVYYYREQYDLALEAFRAAEREARAMAPTAKDVATSERNIYLVTARVSSALAELGRLDEALVSRREALGLQTRAVERDPNNVSGQFDLAGEHQSVGVLLYREKKYAEALVSLDRSIAIADAAFKASPDQRAKLFDAADTHAWRGKALLGLGRTVEAVDALRRALDMGAHADVSARKPAEQFEFHEWLGDALHERASEAGSADLASEARRSWQTALDGYRSLEKAGDLPKSYVAQIPVLEEKLRR
ncbi:MAG: protein kinase [Vicinamibacterales bacterium]